MLDVECSNGIGKLNSNVRYSRAKWFPWVTKVMCYVYGRAMTFSVAVVLTVVVGIWILR